MALIPDDSAWPWTGSDVADPRAWILTGEDPAARWQLLTGSVGRGPDDPDVRTAREQVLADPATADLIARLPDWEGGAGFSGHNSPAFAPNLLNLLADMGLQAADDARISDLLDRMLDHQDSDGRFQSFAPLRGAEQPVWGALLCDTHAITEVLVRYGRGDDPRVRVALDRMSADLATTAQGPAWPCRPDPATGFHGPGRRGDLCPQVSIEGLRTFSLLPEPCAPRNCPRWLARSCQSGVIGPPARPTCSATGAASRPASGRRPGTARSRSSRPSAATRRCGVALVQIPSIAVGRLSWWHA